MTALPRLIQDKTRQDGKWQHGSGGTARAWMLTDMLGDSKIGSVEDGSIREHFRELRRGGYLAAGRGGTIST